MKQIGSEQTERKTAKFFKNSPASSDQYMLSFKKDGDDIHI